MYGLCIVDMSFLLLRIGKALLIGNADSIPWMLEKGEIGK